TPVRPTRMVSARSTTAAASGATSAAAAPTASVTRASPVTRMRPPRVSFRTFAHESTQASPRLRVPQQPDVGADALHDERPDGRAILAKDAGLAHPVAEVARTTQLERVFQGILAFGNELGANARFSRLFAADQLAGAHEALRDRRPGAEGERVRSEGKSQAELHLRRAEPRVLGDQKEACGDRKLEAAGDDLSFREINDRLGRVPRQLDLRGRLEHEIRVDRVSRQDPEVGAPAERPNGPNPLEAFGRRVVLPVLDGQVLRLAPFVQKPVPAR